MTEPESQPTAEVRISTDLPGAAFVLCIFAAIFVFHGEPDLIDAAIHYMMKD